MIRRLAPIALLALAALALPRGVAAQDVTATAGTDMPSVSDAPVAQAAVGPTLDGATAGFQREATQGAERPVAAAAVRNTSSTALMIVGGAAFLAGALIGGDPGTIIMIGGAGVGLYGLYLYLQ